MKLRTGEVVIDRKKSHLRSDVLDILPEALVRIEGGAEFIVAEVDFGRIVGDSLCVLTQTGDEIVYARRLNRIGFTRFVKNRQAEPCSMVTVILKWDDPGECYVVITAFVGHRAEPEPWDFNATANSRAFWDSHALIWGSNPTISDTETTACPW